MEDRSNTARQQHEHSSSRKELNNDEEGDIVRDKKEIGMKRMTLFEIPQDLNHLKDKIICLEGIP